MVTEFNNNLNICDKTDNKNIDNRRNQSTSTLPATILWGPCDTTVLRGARVVLETSYAGNPEPSVQWLRAVSQILIIYTQCLFKSCYRGGGGVNYINCIYEYSVLFYKYILGIKILIHLFKNLIRFIDWSFIDNNYNLINRTFVFV